MTRLLLHWANATRHMLARPLAWLVLVVGCFMGLSNVVLFIGEGGSVRDVLPYALAAVLPLLWLVLLAAMLPSARRTPAAGWLESLPALPIGQRSRVLAEVAAALTLEWAPRTVWLVLGWWPGASTISQHWRLYAVVAGPPLLLLGLAVCLPLVGLGSRPSRPGALSARRVLWALALALVALALAFSLVWDWRLVRWYWVTSGYWGFFGGDLVLGLPILAALAGSRRVSWVYSVRVASTYVIIFLLVVLALALRLGPTALYALALALTVFVFASMGHEPGGHRASPRASSRPSHEPRAAAVPSRRLQLDTLRRSLVLFGLVVLPALGCVVVGPALARGVGHPAWLLLVPAGLGGIFVAAFYPLLLPLLGDPPQLLPSRYCASWAWLPVRPEAVRRSAYLHGLLIGASFVVAVGLIGLGGRPLTPGIRLSEVSAQTWVFGGLIVLGWAGFTLASAAGDRARSIASGAGVVLAITGLLASLVYEHHAMPLAIVAAAFAAALPLPHLRSTARS